MVDIVKVNIRGVKQVQTTLSRVGRFPKVTIDVTRKWGKILERDIKTSARQAKIKQNTRTIYGKGIRWDQKPKGKIGRLFVRREYIFLDSMKPHWVNMRSSRTRLVSWGEQAMADNLKHAASQIRDGSKRFHRMYVKPHPFLRRGFMRARPKLTKLIKGNVTIKKGG